MLVFITLVSTAGEDRGKVLEGFANSLVLFWQCCGGKGIEQTMTTHADCVNKVFPS